MICFDDDVDGMLHDQSFNDQRKRHQSFTDHTSCIGIIMCLTMYVINVALLEYEQHIKVRTLSQEVQIFRSHNFIVQYHKS